MHSDNVDNVSLVQVELWLRRGSRVDGYMVSPAHSSVSLSHGWISLKD